MSRSDDLIQYLQESISTPLLEQDPVYQALRIGGIRSIVEQVIRQRGCTVNNIPLAEEEAIILLAKKEIYMRLATNMAPEWDIETQYTKLLKATRFEHYIKLVTVIQDEITILQRNGHFNTVGANEIYISARNGYARNYQLAPAQYPVLTVANITSTSADFSWNQFDVTISRFSAYELFIGRGIMYDEFEDPKLIKSNIIKNFFMLDGRRTALRVKELTPATNYHALLLFRSTNQRVDYHQIQFTTIV